MIILKYFIEEMYSWSVSSPLKEFLVASRCIRQGYSLLTLECSEQGNCLRVT